MEVDKIVRVVERVEVPMMPAGAAWAPALLELARQIDTDRIYDRDLHALAEAIGEIFAALDRRPWWRRRTR